MATALAAAAPAILKIVFHVLPGMRESFERTLREMVETGKTSPGRLGVDVLKPALDSDDPDEWLVVLRYRTEADLAAWRTSREATATRARLDAMTIGAPRAQRVHGLEAWFSIPDGRGVSSPAKWKMAIVTVMAIYPLILFVSPVLAPLTRGAPRWLAILIEMAMLSPLMTWVVLPTLMRLMGKWLFSNAATSNRTDKISNNFT